jgi:hypothetical protein
MMRIGHQSNGEESAKNVQEQNIYPPLPKKSL